MSCVVWCSADALDAVPVERDELSDAGQANRTHSDADEDRRARG
jgi:hypothetical protein